MLSTDEIMSAFEDCIFTNLTNENYYDNIIKRMDSTFDFDYTSGISKLVIIPDNEDIVIKIPLCGQTNEYYDPDNEDSDESPIWYFSEAGGCWDYCSLEEENYHRAKKRGVDKFFAETEWIGFVKGHPIYIQKRVAEVFELHRDSSSYKNRQGTREKCKNLGVNCFHSCWLSDFLSYYTEQDLFNLDMFLCDCGIGDLHGGNLGYMKDGRPIIFDYSDFWD